MTRSLQVLTVLCTALAVPGIVLAGPTMDEPEEDAGQSLSSAVDVRGENDGPVFALKGSLKGSAGLRGENGDWCDLYRINIVDPFQFAVETYFLDDGGVRDPMLYLFDEQGRPLIAMNDIDQNNPQARLTNADADGNALFTAPGIFYLAITTSWFEPGVWEDEQGEPRFVPIFEMGLDENFYGPVYPSAGNEHLVFSDWIGHPDDADAGDYEIGMLGVGSVPAPGAVALLALAGFGCRSRRRV